MRDYFCQDQFTNLLIRPANDGNVTIGPCCNTRGSKVDPKTFDFNTNPYLLEIRDSARRNERAAACINCWQQEDAGNASRRSVRNDPDTYEGVFIKTMDYTTQNICNLACIQCNPGSSSLWAQIRGYPASAEESYQDKLHLLKNVDLSKIENFHITGGEPLMTREHVKLLEMVDKLDRLDKITISYNTNGTIIPDQTVLDLWKKPTSLNLMVSVDAVGGAAELLRWPCRWADVDKFVRHVVDIANNSMPNLHVSLNVCVASYNFFELEDLIQWAESIDPNIRILWQLVNDSWQHPSVLPRSLWARALDMIARQPRLASWTKHFSPILSDASADWQQLVHWLDDLDRQRNTNWRGVLKLGSLVE